MDIFIIILSFLFFILGILGCFLPVIPGPPLAFVAVLLLELFTEYSFNDEIYQKYNQVDFAITRSGASTISELIFFNIPFLAIPLPKSKDNHQFYNAKDYFDKKLCWLTNQSDYKKENLKEFILNLIHNPDDYLEKKNNMSKFSYQNTWNNINQKLLALINEN